MEKNVSLLGNESKKFKLNLSLEEGKKVNIFRRSNFYNILP